MGTRSQLRDPKWNNMDQRETGIIVQVCYKAHAEVESIAGVNFEAVKSDAQALIKIIQELGGKVDVPFHNAPARGEKVVGNVCDSCHKGHYVENPKTNKIFCDQKCWLNK